MRYSEEQIEKITSTLQAQLVEVTRLLDQTMGGNQVRPRTSIDSVYANIRRAHLQIAEQIQGIAAVLYSSERGEK